MDEKELFAAFSLFGFSDFWRWRESFPIARKIPGGGEWDCSLDAERMVFSALLLRFDTRGFYNYNSPSQTGPIYLDPNRRLTLLTVLSFPSFFEAVP